MFTIEHRLPSIIQGGMGVGVSNWSLARAVSQAGQLGVVSGTALSTVLVRRLQNGDRDGLMREALKVFPIPEMAESILKRYFLNDGRRKNDSFQSHPMPKLSQRLSSELAMVANFVEVHLAKRRHNGIVGLNLLEKIQIPTLPSLFGAMLAGVDCILMGAGIPRAIPRILDQLARQEPAELKIDVQGSRPDEGFVDRIVPHKFGLSSIHLSRPSFIGIVSSTVLAKTLAKRADGVVDGLVVEGIDAGGHNAPPRGPLQLDDAGEPIFGERDHPDIEQIRQLGLPFWLAGSYGRPGKLAAAQTLGAVGIQVGTAFAFCEESGLLPELKTEAIEKSRQGKAIVFTDPYASPTGFPFKTLQADDSLSEPEVYQSRERVCDLGYLRIPYRLENGAIGYRCPGEPEEDYLRKGGLRKDTVGRKCICNGLLSAIGLGQFRQGRKEPALLTAGKDANRISNFLSPGKTTYSASDVIRKLLAPLPPFP